MTSPDSPAVLELSDLPLGETHNSHTQKREDSAMADGGPDTQSELALKEKKIRDLEAQVEMLKKEPSHGGDGGGQSELRALPHPPHVCLEWTHCREDLPTKMYEGQAVYLDSHVYVGGGKCKNKDDDKVIFKFDLARQAWNRLQACRNRSFALVTHNGKVLAIAGTEIERGKTLTDEDYSDAVLELSANEKWLQTQTYKSINTPRIQASAVSHKDHIIVAGGKDNRMHMTSVEVYNPRTQNWSEAAPLPSQLYSCSSAVLNDPAHGQRWFLVGGPKQEKAVYTVLLDSLIDSTSSDQACALEHPWREMECLGTELVCSSVVPIGGTAILAIGGCYGRYSYATVMAFTLEHCKWFEMKRSLPIECYSAAAVAISEKEVMVIGGATATIYRDSVFRGELVKSRYAADLLM